MTEQKVKNFLDLPREHSEYHTSEIVLLPVPFDKGPGGDKGIIHGPQALINASAQLEWYDIETGGEVYRKGIHTAPAIIADSPEQMVEATSQQVSKYLADEKFVVCLGGAHAISEGSIKAHTKLHSEVSVLQLDAHANLRESDEGSAYSNACIMHRIKECVSSIVAVGIRSMDRSEILRIDPDGTFFAQTIHGSYDWIEGVVHRLNSNVYISIDLDVLDPGIMPSVSSPEPGGISWYQLTALLQRVAKTRNIIGADLVGLSPQEGNKAPDVLAAKILHKLFSYKFR